MTILKKVLTAGISVCGGGLAFYSLNNFGLDQFKVNASWTTNYTPSVKWDSNWDRRDPASIVRPSKGEADDQRYKTECENAKPTAKRHIFLIRHGQYNMEAKHDFDRVLTPLGREQATRTGQRLQELGYNYTHLKVSTMTRAKETAALIHPSLPKCVEPEYCQMLEEGAPIPPEPPVGDWRPEPHQFYQDGARIEAAFRKHIHRADVKQKTDSFEVIVCHGNVIRYFICRALQLPPEAWLRLGLHHASITFLTIQPSGRVVLRTTGESGHLPPNCITS